MSFLKPNTKVKQDFNLYRGHVFYVPGVKGMFVLFALFLAGAAIGTIIVGLMSAMFIAFSGDAGIVNDKMLLLFIVAYVTMFIPPMIYVGYKSHSNSLFETGYSLDSNHFGRFGAAFTALAAAGATVAAAVVTEPFSLILPEMSDDITQAMKMMTEGPLVLSLLSVSVLAPVFEEWLCRGMVLRGLLRHVGPAAAIMISAAFFALLHLNIWQAVPAFLLGCLFGYAYYRTGSLKLTMLMHCVNNTFAVVLSRPESLKDADSLIEVTGTGLYAVLFALSAVMLAAFIYMLGKIPIEHGRSNCDPVENEI